MASTTSLSTIVCDGSTSSVCPEVEKASLGNASTTLVDTYGNKFEVPNYTMQEIYDAIPKHCFERSGMTGLCYVVRDLSLLGGTFWIFNHFCTPTHVPSFIARSMLWTLYTIIQGLLGTGLWVLAHECNHQSFSTSKTLNDTVGWTLHSALLVPYFSWKITHRKHHKAAGNMQRDMHFLPPTREGYDVRFNLHRAEEMVEETPVYTALMLLRQQLFGWPAYLLANVTGSTDHENQREGRGVGKRNDDFTVNHFSLDSPLFDDKDVFLILLYGWINLLIWYIIPYLWVNHWLIAIPWLHHADPSVPHYTDSVWTFARGSAATIDRDFGFIGRHILHGIIETHVLHHHVSTIPFYHAEEATLAIKRIMGAHYRSDVEGGPLGFFRSLWRCARGCQWVEPNGEILGDEAGVLFWRNRNGFGVPPSRTVDKS